MGCCKNNKCVSKSEVTLGTCNDPNDGNKCCPSGKKKDCKSDNDCQSDTTEINEPFSNIRLCDITKLKSGYFSVDGSFIKNGKPTPKYFAEKDHDLSKWLHQENFLSNGKRVKNGPVLVYDKIVELYGKPDVIANQPRGLCIWFVEQNNNDIHHSIELRDEYVDHCVPAKHNDFLYSYIKIYVPPKKIKQVLAVSGSVGYDGLQKLLYARCASFEANMATLASVFLVLNNKDPNYVYKIKNRFASYEDNLKFVRKELKKNQRKYKKEMDLSYYDLAFPKGCQ